MNDHFNVLIRYENLRDTQKQNQSAINRKFLPLVNSMKTIFLQEQNGFPQLETLCLACGTFAGVPRIDQFLHRFVNSKSKISTALNLGRACTIN